MFFCKRDPFLKPKTLRAFSTRIFRYFVQIFVKSKLSEVLLHPRHSRLLHHWLGVTHAWTLELPMYNMLGLIHITFI